MTELCLEVDRWRLDAGRLEGKRSGQPPPSPSPSPASMR